MEDKDYITSKTTQIKRVWDNSREQRDAANEDMRFVNVPGGMWEDWLDGPGEAYDADRVRLEFDLTSPYINGFVGEWKSNRAGIYFSPDDDATTDDDAEQLTGIYRADFNDNDGKISIDTAVEEAAECGVGHFQLKTKFEDPDNPEDERQKTCWEPLPNSFSYVIWDDNSRRLDKADARWCCVLTPYTDEAYDEAFPGAETKSSAFQPYTRAWLDWDGGTEFIIVAEFYEIKQKAQVLHVYGNLETGQVAAYPEDKIDDIKDELTDQGWQKIRERKVTIQTVEKCIFNGAEILDASKRIPGKYIPIIPMYAYRKYIDNRERYFGFVRKLKDPNRVFNMGISRVAESAAGSPDEVPIFTESQVNGLEDNWARRDVAFQKVRDMKDANGNPVLAGPVGYVKSTPLDANTVASMDITNQHVQLITGNAPQDTVDPDVSGKAINALYKRQNMRTNTVTDNINIALEHGAKVWLSIAEEIYSTRMNKRTLSEDGTPSTVTLNNDIWDEETGKFVASQSIAGKKFKVSARIGPQYETQREATVETLERVMSMVGNDSKYFSPLLAMWMKNISGTGLDELKEFNRQEMLKMGLMEPETDEEKQMLEVLSQQIDPQEELQKAATEQQMAEAANLKASAGEKVAKTKNIQADTAKTIAETVKIASETPSMAQRRIPQLRAVS